MEIADRKPGCGDTPEMGVAGGEDAGSGRRGSATGCAPGADVSAGLVGVDELMKGRIEGQSHQGEDAKDVRMRGDHAQPPFVPYPTQSFEQDPDAPAVHIGAGFKIEEDAGGLFQKSLLNGLCQPGSASVVHVANDVE
jgi:hypothetical protein